MLSRNAHRDHIIFHRHLHSGAFPAVDSIFIIAIKSNFYILNLLKLRGNLTKIWDITDAGHLDNIWEVAQQHPLLDIAFFSDCLKCGCVIEPYHSESVL